MGSNNKQIILLNNIEITKESFEKWPWVILREPNFKLRRKCIVITEDVYVPPNGIAWGRIPTQRNSRQLILILSYYCRNYCRFTEKCSFYENETKFLGFMISEIGFRGSQKKVDGILEFDYPRTFASLFSFGENLHPCVFVFNLREMSEL